jgi:SAM-dependent methyltransferase
MSRPPFDLARVEAATLAAMEQGHRIFQTHRFAQTNVEHVAYLLRRLRPPFDAIVLDAGCGIGETSRLMAQLDDDLSFVNVNISPLQLKHCPTGPRFSCVLADFHQLKLPDASVDAVMFNSSLVQMDEAVALSQAARVLRPGGVLLVNELVRIDHGDGRQLEEKLACRTLTPEQLMDAIHSAGFDIDDSWWPPFDASHFAAMLEQEGLGGLLAGLRPLVVRATKGATR